MVGMCYGWYAVSPPSQGAWIEMDKELKALKTDMSPPSQGAWIEIPRRWAKTRPERVAPLAGGVD